MPVYEYLCHNCGKSFDVLQRLSDARLTNCPQCGRPRLQKRVSVPVVRVKPRFAASRTLVPELAGGRSSIDFEKWMELDMEYIDNWSLGLDLKILFKTIPAVLRGSGAA